MWIANHTLRDLLSKARGDETVSDWLLAAVEDDLKRAERKEEERARQKWEQRIALYREVYAVLAEERGRKLCPTDIQFMLYRRHCKQYSCQKIAKACNDLAFRADKMRMGLPDDLRGVKAQSMGANPRGDNHSYFYL